MTSNPKPPPPEKEDVWHNRTHPVQEDMAFQRASWRFERIGWGILLLILTLALSGLFGGGPLSHARINDTTGQLSIDYERFTRKGSTTEFRVGILSSQDNDETRLRIDKGFLSAFQMEALTPEPVEMRTHPEGTELIFRTGKTGPFVVSLSLRPQGLGLTSSRFALGNNTPVEFWSFIYP